MTLWQIGLIIFIAGGVLNAILINLEDGGLFRELTRLLILSDLVIFFIFLITHKKKKKTLILKPFGFFLSLFFFLFSFNQPFSAFPLKQKKKKGEGPKRGQV